MAKSKNIITAITENKIQLGITIAASAIAIINFLIAARLAPLTQDLALVSQRVEALEEGKEDYVPRSEIDAKFDSLLRSQVRIEEKLDAYLSSNK